MGLVSLWAGLVMGLVCLWGQSPYGAGLVMGLSRYGAGLLMGPVWLWGCLFMGLSLYGPGLIVPLFPVGFLTREERRRLEALRSPYNKFWVPCVWFGALAGQARREGRVRDDGSLKLLMEVRPPPPRPPPAPLDPLHPPNPSPPRPQTRRAAFPP